MTRGLQCQGGGQGRAGGGRVGQLEREDECQPVGGGDGMEEQEEEGHAERVEQKRHHAHLNY